MTGFSKSFLIGEHVDAGERGAPGEGLDASCPLPMHLFYPDAAALYSFMIKQ